MTAPIADVLIPLALDTAYSYAVPAGLALAEGDVVRVPLGTRETVGVVWALREGGAANLKSVAGRVDAPGLPGPLRKFLDWVAWYTLSPRGSALSMSLKVAEEIPDEAPRIGVRLAGPPPARMTPARTKVLAAAQGGALSGKRELADLAGVSLTVIDGLVDEGTLEAVTLPPEPVAGMPDPAFARPALSPAQAEAAAAMVRAVAQGGPGVTLLEGVTGSGKTET